MTQLQTQFTQKHFLKQHLPEMTFLTGDSNCAFHVGTTNQKSPIKEKPRIKELLGGILSNT